MTDSITGVFGMEQECPDHGDEGMVECRVCGIEFCRTCFPGARTCPHCADEHELDDDEDEEPAPAESIDDLDKLLTEDDDEVDPLLEEAELLDGDKDWVDDDE